MNGYASRQADTRTAHKENNKLLSLETFLRCLCSTARNKPYPDRVIYYSVAMDR